MSTIPEMVAVFANLRERHTFNSKLSNFVHLLTIQVHNLQIDNCVFIFASEL